MLIIKDAMVLIHLAKLSLLETSCNQFKRVLIPKLVYLEILKGKKKNYPDVPIITKLIEESKIIVKVIKDRELIKKANQFNIQRGEAEVIALYWQENADIIATDDDNVRKKKVLMDLKVIGTPSIILYLYQKRNIDKQKAKQSINELKKIGWFNNTILDKLIMEVEK